MVSKDETLTALIEDGVALTGALIAGDFFEGRFRAELVAGNAQLLGLLQVHAAAVEVTRRLDLRGHDPFPGYAAAVLRLSVVIDRAVTNADVLTPTGMAAIRTRQAGRPDPSHRRG